MKPAIAAWGIFLATYASLAPAHGQPAQPPPTTTVPVADLLAKAPEMVISNGLITAHIARIDAAGGFYNGTRFDQAGVVTSLILGGKEFYGPWFEKTAPEVLDYTYVGEDIVAGPDSAVSGPVEEFAPLDFVAKAGPFVKIGVGVLYQPDALPYDHYRHYRVLNAGERSSSVTQTGVKFTQELSYGAIGYIYEKSVTLVPGKPQLLIRHRLKNTGKARIITTVYDHNFLRLVAKNHGVTVSFPFTPTTKEQPLADLIQLRANTITYLRPMANKERISFLVTGFGRSAGDYDFIVAGGGSSVRVQGDHPVTRMNIFSIDRVQSVEPYIDVDVPAGAEQSWTYTYTFSNRGAPKPSP